VGKGASPSPFFYDVIPAQAGIHFDFRLSLYARSQDKSKIKMDRSLRWNDEYSFLFGVVNE